MITSWILFAYQIQACGAYGCIKQWQYMGEFNTSNLCVEASKILLDNKTANSFRCLPSKEWNAKVEKR